MKYLFAIALSLITLFGLNAQEMHCNLVRLPFEQVINESKHIVLAEVSSSVSHWNEQKTRIYTYSEIRVIEDWSGNSPSSITLITEGGSVDGMDHIFSDRIDLSTDEQLVVLLQEVPKHWTGIQRHENAFAVTASLQGIYRINQHDHAVQDPFQRFKNLTELRSAVSEQAGNGYRQIQPSLVLPHDHVNGSAVAAVSSLSPTSITAGTRSILTISGSGFGAIRGAGFVEFTTATGAFVQPLAKDYVSWSDVQIRVMVPSRLAIGNAFDNAAASGQVRVTPAGGAASLSPGAITVPYALFNNFSSALDSSLIMNLSGQNASGGYALQFNDQFQTLGIDAKPTFTRVISKWNCATQVNWSISTSTTSVRQTGADGINVITDDVLSPLPTGVAGRGENFVATCGTGVNQKSVTVQQDIIFSLAPAGFVWNLGAGNAPAGQIDFETVALHEVGHLHQLAHTRNTSAEVMAASLASGVSKKNLTQNDINGGRDVMARSAISVGCSTPAHTPAPGVITITSSSTYPTCVGSIITFTATTTNVASDAVLQWKRNGVNAGQGTFLTINNPVNNEIVTCEVTNCFQVVSSPITVTLLQNPAQNIFGSTCLQSSGAVTAEYSINDGGFATGTQLAVIIWTLPAGVTFAGQDNTSQVNLNFAPSFTSGQITCEFFSLFCNKTVLGTINVSRSNLATISYTGSFCKTNSSPVNVTRTGVAGGLYSASPNGLNINTSTGAILPSASTPGTYIVRYMVFNNGGCAQYETQTTVTILPSPSAAFSYSQASFCKSVSAQSPTISGVTGGTFTRTPAGLTINATTGVITPSSSTAGTYTVTYTIPASGTCSSVSSTQTVTIFNVLPATGAISGTATNACGVTRTYSVATVAGATSYQWTIPPGAIPVGSVTGNSITLNIPASFVTGFLKVKAISPTLCTNNESSLLLQGTPATPGNINVGTINILALTAPVAITAVSGATSYNWTVTGGTIVSGQGSTSIVVHLNSGSTSVTVCVRAVSACGTSAPSCKTFNGPLFSPEELHSEKAILEAGSTFKTMPVVYPNPATDLLTVSFGEDWTTKNIRFELTDITGKRQSTNMLPLDNTSLFQISISNLKPGLYFLRVLDSENAQTIRFIKE